MEKLDLTKPIQHIRSGEPVRYIGTLKRSVKPILVAFTYHNNFVGVKGEEYVMGFDEVELMNVPNGRWGNVYADTPGIPESGEITWYYTRTNADKAASTKNPRIGVMYDRGYGSMKERYSFFPSKD